MTLNGKLQDAKRQNMLKIFSIHLYHQIEYWAVLRCFITASSPLPKGRILQFLKNSEPWIDITLTMLGMGYEQRGSWNLQLSPCCIEVLSPKRDMTPFVEFFWDVKFQQMLYITRDLVITHFFLIISTKQDTRGKVSSCSPEETQRWVCIISKQRGTYNRKFRNIICSLSLLQYVVCLLGKSPQILKPWTLVQSQSINSISFPGGKGSYILLINKHSVSIYSHPYIVPSSGDTFVKRGKSFYGGYSLVRGNSQ